MRKYALFFDIDGTLVSFKTHQIPPSTIFALTQAKANGHQVFIATGRPDFESLFVFAINWSASNRPYSWKNNKVISCKDISHDAALFAVNDAQEKNYGLIVVGEKDVAVIDPHGEVDRIFRQEIAVENLEKARPVEEVLKQRILQLTPFFSAEYEHEFMAHIPCCTSGRWHPAFTDVTAIGADKGEGILTMARNLNLNPEYTIAFGDGGNDTSMIKTAGIGVAMGNALDTLKQDADYTTYSVDEDGILNALRHFNLI